MERRERESICTAGISLRTFAAELTCGGRSKPRPYEESWHARRAWRICGRPKVDLKFSRVFFGPALYYYFFVGVKFYGIAALSVKIAEETVLPSGEREIGHGRGYADIDADISRGGFVFKTARCRAT